jgi:hypothetical protein
VVENSHQLLSGQFLIEVSLPSSDSGSHLLQSIFEIVSSAPPYSKPLGSNSHATHWSKISGELTKILVPQATEVRENLLGPPENRLSIRLREADKETVTRSIWGYTPA